MNTIKALWRDWKWHALLFLVAGTLGTALLTQTPAPSPASVAATAAHKPFPEPLALEPGALQAQAAVVYDPADGVLLFQKNADVPLPLASLTKLMAADVVLGTENPRATVLISADHTMHIDDLGDLGLRAGTRWSIGDLVRYGLFASSNNAMLAAAGAAVETGGTSTIAAMNARAKEMGLSQSRFYNPTGLDVNSALSGGYGSARDVAIVAADFYQRHPAYFEQTMRPGGAFGPSDGQIVAKPTAAPIEDVPGVLAAKTGYTALAGGNMVAVFDVGLGHPLVAVALHSTKAGRFEDIRTLIEAARSIK